MGNTTLVSRVRKDPSSRPVNGHSSTKGRRSKSQVDITPFVFISKRTVVIPVSPVFTGERLIKPGENRAYRIRHAGVSFTPFIKKEEPAVKSGLELPLHCYELPKGMSLEHGKVIERFGGADNIGVMMRDIDNTLDLQERGEISDLSADGAPNIFYIMNGTGFKPMVVERDEGNGWRIYVESLLLGRSARPNIIEGPCRVFTRGPIVVSP